MKDRDITENEINRITENCPTREQAFITIMRQSGLPPHIIKRLRIGDVERILEPNTPIPCKIHVQHEKFPTFIGEEAIKYLKRYLRNREDNLRPESLLFTIRDNPNKEINTKDVSRTFKQFTRKLLNAHKITYEERKGKPSELRLYSFVGFYRTKAKDYLKQLHKNYTPEEDASFRKLYQKEAMPFLEIEPLPPIEMHQLEKRLRRIEDLLPKEPQDDYGKYLDEHPGEKAKTIREVEKAAEARRNWEKEHPEEAKAIEKQWETFLKAAEEHNKEWHMQFLEEEIAELKRRLNEIENIVKKPKRTRKS